MLAKPWAKLFRHRADAGVFAFAALLIVAIGFASYQRLFSAFAAYDDEGYVMLSLRQFMAGGVLYDDVYSQYGPAYYWIASAFHRITDWPVTHDVTRIKTLVVWMSVSLFAAGWLYRVTHSGAITIAGLLFVSFHLERLAMEPGHPQELCILAVAACMFLGTFVRGDAKDLRVIFAMGVATALCLMTKVNVGLFLFLSLSAALLFATGRSHLRSILLGSVLAAMIALPIVIGRQELLSWHGYRLPVLLTVAVALTSWICTRVDLKPILELRHTLCLWGATCLVTAMIAIGTIAAGTSLADLAEGLLFQHMRFVDIHYHAPPIHALAPLAAVVALLFVRSASTGSKAIRVIQFVAVVLVVGSGIRHLIETFQPLYHGSQDRGQIGLLVSYFLPFVWIILLPLRDHLKDHRSATSETYFARLSLCLIAALQPLIAHPVPGTQMAIGSLALVVAMITAIHDAIESLRGKECFGSFAIPRFATGLVGLLLATMFCRGAYLWIERERMPSMDLDGASRLNLPQELVATERWTVEQLRKRADTFVCLPSGHNSLYLWTGIEPPTGSNATVWQDLLSDDQQREIVAALDARERVCIVVEQSEPPSLRTDGPLLDYILANFEAVSTYGTREIWQRRPDASTEVNVSSRAGAADDTTNVKLGNSRAL
ncbi:MAG: hypothetical protein H8E66_07585 [Planctomycetes bacterium]|nr:hypothetical protein [Planctomycetota bacterium]